MNSLSEREIVHSKSQKSILSQNLSFFKFQCPSFRNIQEFRKKSKKQRETLPQDNNNISEYDNFQEEFEQQIQLDLKRFTSFQNGFMQFHIKILKQSLFDFFKIIQKQEINSSKKTQKQFKDIKQLIFNKNYYLPSDIQKFKNRFLANIQEFKILRQIFDCLNKSQTQKIRNAIQMACFIIQKSDQITMQIKAIHTVNQRSVLSLRQQFQDYLLNYQKVMNYEEKQKNKINFNRFIDSWIYTIVIAKLGYFENDCYSSNLSLYHHLQILLESTEKEYSTASYNNQDEDWEFFNRKQPKKKRKVYSSFFQ